jgi:hypothetical protein
LRRRWFKVASALSLALFAATVVLWARSYWAWDVVQWTFAGHPGELYASQGRVTYHRQDLASFLVRPDRPRWHWHHEASPPQSNDGPAFGIPPEVGWWWRGFGWTSLSTAGGLAVHRFAYAPHWALAALFLALPLAWLASRRRRRSRHEMCAACGYDLRATPDRCPECGAVPQARTEAPHKLPLET